MNYWNGVITIGEHSANVKVNFVVPGDQGLGSWQGSGTCEKFFELYTYETEIGRIIITNISVGSNGSSFTFQGTGKPRGELIQVFRDAE
jgi:hypothetical protein